MTHALLCEFTASEPQPALTVIQAPSPQPRIAVLDGAGDPFPGAAGCKPNRAMSLVNKGYATIKSWDPPVIQVVGRANRKRDVFFEAMRLLSEMVDSHLDTSERTK